MPDAETQRARYFFRVKESRGVPWIMLEPSGEGLPVVPRQVVELGGCGGGRASTRPSCQLTAASSSSCPGSTGGCVSVLIDSALK